MGDKKSVFFYQTQGFDKKDEQSFLKNMKNLKPGLYISTRLWLFVKRHAFPHHLTPYFYCSFANPRLITKLPFLTTFSSCFKDPHFWTRDQFKKLLSYAILHECNNETHWKLAALQTSVFCVLIHIRRIDQQCIFFGQILCQSSKHFLLLER